MAVLPLAVPLHLLVLLLPPWLALLVLLGLAQDGALVRMEAQVPLPLALVLMQAQPQAQVLLPVRGSRVVQVPVPPQRALVPLC